MSFYPFSFWRAQMSTAKHTADWRKRKKQQGLCTQCGKNPSDDGKRCPDCSGLSLRDGKQRFQRRYDKGLCGYCGKREYQEGKKSCSICLALRKKRYADSDKTEQLTKDAVIRRERRHRILEHYGGKCACCGETEPSFLAIDHIDGGGNEHRRQIGNNPHNRCGSSSTQFAKWIEKNNFPDTLQLLCHNCNMGKHLNAGICPHKARISQGILR